MNEPVHLNANASDEGGQQEEVASEDSNPSRINETQTSDSNGDDTTHDYSLDNDNAVNHSENDNGGGGNASIANENSNNDLSVTKSPGSYTKNRNTSRVLGEAKTKRAARRDSSSNYDTTPGAYHSKTNSRRRSSKGLKQRRGLLIDDPSDKSTGSSNITSNESEGRNPKRWTRGLAGGKALSINKSTGSSNIPSNESEGTSPQKWTRGLAGGKALSIKSKARASFSCTGSIPAAVMEEENGQQQQVLSFLASKGLRRGRLSLPLHDTKNPALETSNHSDTREEQNMNLNLGHDVLPRSEATTMGAESQQSVQRMNDVETAGNAINNGEYTDSEQGSVDDVTTDTPAATDAAVALDNDEQGDLAVARPVEEGDAQQRRLDLPQAQQWQSYFHPERRSSSVQQWKAFTRWPVLLCAFVLVVGCVVVVSIFLLANSQNNDGNDAQKTDLASTLTRDEVLMSLMPQETQSMIVVSSENKRRPPQFLAYEWLLDDPNFDTYPAWRLIQRFALATFYFATSGTSAGERTSSWINDTHWLSYTHNECDWFAQPNSGTVWNVQGSTFLMYETTDTRPCGGSDDDDDDGNGDGTFKHLWLHSNNLEGELPDELYLLTNLRSLGLNKNNVRGTLSPMISSLSSLEAIAISNNLLSGTLPLALTLLSNLTNIHLFNQRLEGTIPTEVGQLKALKWLEIDTNLLTGNVPSELGNLSSLHSLNLQNNDLNGTIPASIGSLISLDYLNLDNNTRITGCLPTEIGQMRNLTSLSLKNLTSLECSLPSELGLLESLNTLIIMNTSITGTIPTTIGKLSNLGKPGRWRWQKWSHRFGLTLSTSRLSGAIPSELGLLSSLRVLFLIRNKGLNSTLPSEIFQLKDLHSMSLYDNQISGSIPTEIGECSSLFLLRLQSNKLQGSLPSEIAMLGNTLKHVHLSHNQLTGPVLTELGQLSKLSSLWLGDNMLSGKLPSSLGDLTKLSELFIGGNALTGTLPSIELSRLSHLVHLQLNATSINGFIPSQVGLLKFLQTLDLSYCDFSQQLPSEIGLLGGNLTYLNLSHNALTGPLPMAELGQLTLLESLDLSGNIMVSGTIPEKLCLLNSSLIVDCSDRLCGCDCPC